MIYLELTELGKVPRNISAQNARDENQLAALPDEIMAVVVPLNNW
uniref:Uncharacterized protein n=1 Tax=Tetraselmis sp. GSL018 TaxID=582737 RepID=A0A061RI11_9CHLO